MGRENIHGLMVIFMKEVSGLTKDKEKGLFIILQGVGMKATGKMIKNKVKEFFFKTRGPLKSLIVEDHYLKQRIEVVKYFIMNKSFCQ